MSCTKSPVQLVQAVQKCEEELVQILRAIQRTLFQEAAHKMKRVRPGRGSKPFLALWLGPARLMASRSPLRHCAIGDKVKKCHCGRVGAICGTGATEVNVTNGMALVMHGKKLGVVKVQLVQAVQKCEEELVQILRAIQRTLFQEAAHKMKRVRPGRGSKPFLALWLGPARLMASRCTCLTALKMQLVKV
uniref:Uncharacterized protein n=1 Tax=Globodera rostochiensis TaxID=31243 RepID=A0A914HAF1_GLORO